MRRYFSRMYLHNVNLVLNWCKCCYERRAFDIYFDLILIYLLLIWILFEIIYIFALIFDVTLFGIICICLTSFTYLFSDWCVHFHKSINLRVKIWTWEKINAYVIILSELIFLYFLFRDFTKSFQIYSKEFRIIRHIVEYIKI